MNYIIKSELIKSVFYGFFFAIWSFTSTFFLFYFFDLKIGNKQSDISTNYFVILMIAPILETLLFNSLPYYLLKKVFSKHYYLIIIISTLLFSISHLQSVFLLLLTIPVGYFLSYRYYWSSEKYDEFISTFYTIISHFVMNFTILTVKICSNFN